MSWETSQSPDFDFCDFCDCATFGISNLLTSSPTLDVSIDQ